MKKIGWYIIATIMTVVFLIGAMIEMLGEALIQLCHWTERRYWNYEADGYRYEGDGIYTKSYNLKSVSDLVSDEHQDNVRNALAKVQADLEAEPNRLANPTGICPSCNQERLINGSHKSPLHGGVCAGWGNGSGENAKRQWAYMHGPDPVECSQCAGSSVLGEIRGVRCTKCQGSGTVYEQPAGKAELQWSTEHLGPGAV